MNGTSDMAFWATKTAGYLEPLRAAAILAGLNAEAAAGWVNRDAPAEAEDILRAHGLDNEADRLAELRIEPRLTATSIKTAMTAALARHGLQS